MNNETVYFLTNLEHKLENIFRKSKNQLITMLTMEVLDDLRGFFKENINKESKNCAHVWNHKHESGFVVCDKCEKVYAE